MKQRCHNPKYHGFHKYGGRGIQVCAEWRDNFEAFAAYVGPRPAGLTIERIKNDGHYAPGNVRWATDKEQARNRRSSLLVVCAGAVMPLAEACDTRGLNYETTRRGLHRLGSYRGLTMAPVEEAPREPLAIECNGDSE